MIDMAAASPPKSLTVLLTMLSGLARCDYVARGYLLAASDKITAYRALKAGITKGYMSESTVTQKIRGKTYRTRYYSLTMEGAEYLSEHEALLHGESQSQRILDASGKAYGKRPSLSADKMARYLSVSGTAFLMTLIGAAVSPITPATGERKNGAPSTDRTDREENTDGWIAQALDDFPNFSTEGDAVGKYVFRNSYEVKKAVSGRAEQYGGYHAGRYTGILESPQKSVLVYVGARGGMSWSKIATKPEFGAHHAYSVHYSDYKNLPGGENHGIMFVQNARTFADLYLDTAGKRKDDEFADRFDSFIIFPIDCSGVANAMEFADNKVAEYEHEIVVTAIKSGVCEKNTSGYTSLFPLRSAGGVPTAVGAFIDCVKLNRIRKVYEKTGIACSMICYPWQVDFYRRVIPNAKFVTLRSC